MDYIVNPWLIYLVGTLNVINGVLIITIGLSIIFLGFFLDDGYSIDKKYRKRAVAVTLVSTLLFILVPNSDTGYKMLAASIVTKQNIDGVTEYSQKQLDVIIEKISKINQYGSNDK
jgi:hypothetical protein